MESKPDAVTKAGLRRAAQAIASDFGTHLARYDEKEYRPEVLARLRLVFARPLSLQPEDVHVALRWKFGQLGTSRYPAHRRRLASTIAEVARSNEDVR
ncbi:MAG: hypothetical protein AB7N65_13105 [Vicinamibacterales bacterium]